jgi:hypothetical protein
MEWKPCETTHSDKMNGIEQSEYSALWYEYKRDTGTVKKESLLPTATFLHGCHSLTCNKKKQ